MQCWLVGSFILVALAIGCAQATRERLKHFFFEVPAEETTSAHNKRTEAGAAPADGGLVLPPPRFQSHHPPYVQRACSSCHDAEARMQVRTDYMNECQDCHERYFAEEVWHFPVAEGDCALCHLPHRSEFAALLRTDLFNTCVDCHDEPVDLSQDAHGGEGVENCIACHDAHFGKSPMLKEGFRRAGAAKEQGQGND